MEIFEDYVIVFDNLRTSSICNPSWIHHWQWYFCCKDMSCDQKYTPTYWDSFNGTCSVQFGLTLWKRKLLHLVLHWFVISPFTNFSSFLLFSLGRFWKLFFSCFLFFLFRIFLLVTKTCLKYKTCLLLRVCDISETCFFLVFCNKSESIAKKDQ